MDKHTRLGVKSTGYFSEFGAHVENESNKVSITLKHLYNCVRSSKVYNYEHIDDEIKYDLYIATYYMSFNLFISIYFYVLVINNG